MMKRYTIPTAPTLFLHMGPGLHSRIEESVLGSHFPNVYFWDQPYISSADQGQAFSVLSKSAIEAAERLYSKSGTPIAILAHSFGGQLIRPILAAMESKILSCHFVSTGLNLPFGFLNLLKVMRDAPDTHKDLREKLNEFILKDLRSQEELMSHFWEMIGLVALDTSYVRHYWPDRNQFQKYLDLASKAPGLHFETFQFVLNDFLNNHFLKINPYSGQAPIQITLGGRDPLLDLQTETESWKKIYPKSDILVHSNSGHFIHLEEYL